MIDPERLSHLVSELGDDPAYAIGARRFPEAIDDEDAAAIAEALAEEMDAGTAMRAELARKGGHHIACGSGCNSCCEVMVMVYRPEALRIAEWLKRPEQAAVRAAFLQCYDAWREAVGDTPEQLSEHFAGGRGPAYDALHMEQWRRRVLCAFNREGRCAIYEVRPVACRYAHALDTADRCLASADRPAAALSFVPLDEFMKTATRLLRGAHNAGPGGRHRQRAIPAAVYALLQADAEEAAP